MEFSTIKLSEEGFKNLDTLQFLKETKDLIRIQERTASEQTVAIANYVKNKLKSGVDLKSKNFLFEEFINSNFGIPFAGILNEFKYKQILGRVLPSLRGLPNSKPVQQTQTQTNSLNPETPEVKLSDKTKAILAYATEQGEESAESAENSCLEKYRRVYATVDMALSEKVSKNSAIIAGDPGIGKCLANSTKVLLGDGSVTTMGEIQVGQKVVTPENRLTEVLEVHHQPDERWVYEVTYEDGRSQLCDTDQIFRTYRQRTFYSFDKGKQVKKFTYANETLQSLLNDLNNKAWIGKPKFYIPLPEAIDCCFEEKSKLTLPIDPYLLGTILTSGEIKTQNKVTLKLTDKNIKNYIEEKLLKVNCSLEIVSPNTYCIIQNLDSPSTFSSSLESLGLLNIDCSSVSIPDLYKKASISERLELIQSIMDTEGKFKNWRSKKVEYKTSSKTFAKDIAEIIYSLGGTCELKQKRNLAKSDIYTVSLRLPNKVGKDGCPFKLTSKAKKYKSFLKDKKPLENLAITEIVQVGLSNTTCILVDDSTHLYLTGDFIVTHNTYSALEVLADRGYEKILEGNPVGKQYLYNNGSIGTSRESVTWFLYQHRNNEIIVLDDCDSFLVTENPSINNTLKAALTTGKYGGTVTCKDLKLRKKLSSLMERVDEKDIGPTLRIQEEIQSAANLYQDDYGYGNDDEVDEDTNPYNKVSGFLRNYMDKSKKFKVDEDNIEDEDSKSEETVDEDNIEDDDTKPDSLSFPEIFTFTSRLICITNVKFDKINSAVLSRSNCYEIHLTPEEFLCRLDMIKDNLGTKESRLDPEELKWHRDVCIDVLKVAIELEKAGKTVKGRYIKIGQLEFRIVTALMDYSVARTEAQGIDVLETDENFRTQHIFNLLSHECLDLLNQ